MQSRQADKAAWQGRPRLRILVLGVAIIAAACSNGGGGLNQGAGGGSASGGSDGSGGTPSSGGSPGTGGGTATGGSVGTGGQTATGGAVGSGGQSAKGGASGTGGALGSGGAPGSGGAAAAGGQQASGGRGPGGAAGGTGGAGGSAGGVGGMAGAKSGGPSAPCDIYQAAGTPCAAAHSTVRALYGAYSGPLYQVSRASDNTTKDIPVLTAGGFADSSLQDSFCSGTTCTIPIIYDQSPHGNHLRVTWFANWLPKGGKPAAATAAKITVGGHTVYGIKVTSGSDVAYRTGAPLSGTASVANGSSTVTFSSPQTLAKGTPLMFVAELSSCSTYNCPYYSVAAATTASTTATLTANYTGPSSAATTAWNEGTQGVATGDGPEAHLCGARRNEPQRGLLFRLRERRDKRCRRRHRHDGSALLGSRHPVWRIRWRQRPMGRGRPRERAVLRVRKRFRKSFDQHLRKLYVRHGHVEGSLGEPVPLRASPLRGASSSRPAMRSPVPLQ